MAVTVTQATIDRLRTRLRDEAKSGPATAIPSKEIAVNEEVDYIDAVYTQCVEFAAQKLSFDFGVDPPYSADTAVPAARQFLLTKLATIELCFIRAADIEDSSSDFTSLAVPDLSVSSGAPGSQFWLDLANKLQTEYDGEVGTRAGAAPPGTMDNLPEVQVGSMFRVSTRTGTRTQYNLDEALDAPGSFAAGVSAGVVTLTWSPVLSEHFNSYEIYRSATLSELTPYPAQTARIRIIPDVHGLWTDGSVRPQLADSPGSGTWYYVMSVVNSNSLRSYTSVVSAVVP